MFFPNASASGNKTYQVKSYSLNDAQHTISEAVTITGTGLHTGKPVNLTFKPAPPNHGFKFKRVDIEGQPIIKADADYVVEVERGTTLEYKGVKISTVEHALAALMGLQIDNVLIELDAQELPIMDGSAQPFVDALLEAGITPQDAKKQYFPIRENIHFYDEEKDVDMLIVPANDYEVTVMIDFNSPILGKQHASISHLTEFVQEIAPARTFCFLHELEMLLKHDLIKGGDLSNAIVVVDKQVEQDELNRLAKLFNKENVKVRQEGYLNNLELRHSNEPARHKLLDVIGDLSLVGTPIKGKIIATKPGHATNVEFAKMLKKHIRENKHLIGMPTYDPSKAPVFDINSVIDSLPHRFPLLLVDKITEINEEYIVGIKNVTYNEQFFQGHFPGHPIMPGVLQIEAMAQCGGVFMLSQVDNPENFVTYFLKIDNARFRNPVKPGDTLIIKMEIISPIRRGLCEMKGTAYVGNKIATEAKLTAQIVKKKRI